MVSLNKTFYGLFLLMLVLGLYLYQLGWFKPMDELVTLLFALLCVLDILANKNHSRYKGLFAVIGVMTFYLFYSMFALHYNSTQAILSDFFIQIKSFIAFYVAYSMGVSFNLSQKEFLKKLCLVLSVLMFAIIVAGFGMNFFFHPAYYGMISTILFLIYYYCASPHISKLDKIILFLILTVGLLSTRSKFYGFYVVALYIFFLYKPSLKFKISPKQILVGLVVLAGVLYVAWGKIDYYFISSGIFSGITDIDDMDDSFARAALYMKAPEILIDHPIFGTGLASYATYSSGVVGYSDVLRIYGLDQVWGLLEGDCPFISDTFFPELVQFGLVGIILFFSFWVWVYRKIKIRYLTPLSVHVYKIGLLILAFLFVESVANSSFLQSSGIISMILLGLVVKDAERIQSKPNAGEEDVRYE